MISKGMDPKEGIDCIGYAAFDAQSDLVPFKFKRRFPGAEDVVIRVTHCGICYGELVWTKNYHGDSKYPVVPGHEVVGVVTEVGKGVINFEVGERVGIGYFVMSCRECKMCNTSLESYCTKGLVRSFNETDVDGTMTRGGFSSLMVTNERYVVHIPNKLPSDLAAPLVCAGITVYSPMKTYGLDKGGKYVGVVGLGGLGHLAVRFAKAMGNHVTVLSTSASKKDEAIKELGADAFIVSKDDEAVKAAAFSMDFILDTASGNHPIDPYLSLLSFNGVFVLVGVTPEMKFSPINVILARRTITGSCNGGIKEIQEMLDFAAEKGVVPMIETIPINDVNEALKRLQNNDVRYRFVIDIEKSLKE